MPDALASGWRTFAAAVAKPRLATDAAPKIAAGVVFRAPDGSVLLLKRSAEEKNFAGHWALPGGGADPGETAEQAARRECREEIGREPAELRKVSERKTPTGLVFHTFEAKADKFTPKLNAEHTAHVWARPDALPSPMHPAVKDTLAGGSRIEARLDRLAERRGGGHAADAGLRALAMDRDKWISVHPGGPGSKGVPVLLGPGGVVKGGLGGKFTGQKISEVKGPGSGRPNSRASAHAAFAPEHKAAPKWKASTASVGYSFAPAGHAYSVSVTHAAEKVGKTAAAQTKAAHAAAEKARGVVSDIEHFTGEEAAPTVKGGPAGVFMFDAGSLKTDAKRFQYKDNGDAHGVTVALKGVTKWDASKANQVIAWEDHDGQVYVVDGHQRTGLARRLIAAGHEKDIRIPGILYRAKDGVDADDIRCIAAAKNIAEGSGSPIDGAKILKTRPELMDGSMPISRTEARQSFELAKLNDEAFRMVTNEVVPYQQAAVVGRYIPDDAARQNAAMKALARFEPRNETEAQVLVQRVAQSELEKANEGAQTSMFGELDEADSTAGEEMRIVAKAIAELKKDKTLFSRVVSNAERIEETGSSIEREAAEGVKQDSEIFIKRLTSEAYSKGPLRDKLVAAAKELKIGKVDAQGATRQILDTLRRKSESDVSTGSGAGGGKHAEPEAEHERDDSPGFFGDAQVRSRQIKRRMAVDADPIQRGFRALAMDAAGERWITVRSHGDGPGSPVKIDGEGKVVAGMGGRFNGKPIGEAHGKTGRANSRASAHAAFAGPGTEHLSDKPKAKTSAEAKARLTEHYDKIHKEHDDAYNALYAKSNAHLKATGNVEEAERMFGEGSAELRKKRDAAYEHPDSKALEDEFVALRNAEKDAERQSLRTAPAPSKELSAATRKAHEIYAKYEKAIKAPTRRERGTAQKHFDDYRKANAEVEKLGGKSHVQIRDNPDALAHQMGGAEKPAAKSGEAKPASAAIPGYKAAKPHLPGVAERHVSSAPFGKESAAEVDKHLGGKGFKRNSQSALPSWSNGKQFYSMHNSTKGGHELWLQHESPEAKDTAMDACPIAAGLRKLAAASKPARDCSPPVMATDALTRGLRALAMDAGKWDEGKHKRGQPGNAGQFGPGGAGGGSKAKSAGGKPEAKASAPAAKAAPAKPAAKSAEKPAGGPVAKPTPTTAAKPAPAQVAKPAAPAGGKAPAAPSAPAAASSSFAPVASKLYAKASAGMPHTEEGRAKLAAEITEKLGATKLVADARARLAKAIPTDAPVDKGGFRDGEGWTPERMAIHDKLLSDLFTPAMIAAAKPKDGEKPTVSIFGGRGGSGKSYLSDKAKGGPVDAASTVVIDADHFKAHLPGYEGWNAAMFHEESSELFDRAVDIARKLGLNCALDMTLKSPGKAEAYAERFKPDNYEVDGYYMFASPQTATNGAVSRFKNGMDKNGKGRFVPPEIVMGNVKNEENFDRAIPLFRNWAVYDNNDRLPTGPKLVSKGERAK